MHSFASLAKDNGDFETSLENNVLSMLVWSVLIMTPRKYPRSYGIKRVLSNRLLEKENLRVRNTTSQFYLNHFVGFSQGIAQVHYKLPLNKPVTTHPKH